LLLRSYGCPFLVDRDYDGSLFAFRHSLFARGK
jgi:hypothetical protein